LYILPGFPSPTNSHGFWAAPPVADEEDDEAATTLLAVPFAAMLLGLKRAKRMAGKVRRADAADAEAGTPERNRIAAVAASPYKTGSCCRV
jgi:hypothetical protein